MNYRKEFHVKPESRLQLKDFDPQFADKREDKHSARAETAELQARMDEFRFQLFVERKYWDDCKVAYEDELNKCSTDDAPWFVIPSYHKWLRNLAISHIIVETMERLRIQVPKATVNIADIRKRYHQAVVEEKSAK
jgi:Polyphosphate kinase 2 (PPK2)